MKKKVVSTILVIVMMLTTALPITTFASSNLSSWAVEEVNAAINADLVTDSVMENYQADITREQFCEMVVNAYEKISGENAEIGNIYFSDTSNVEILKAANLGIVTGYGNNVFGPNDLITREQIATMLVRMIDKSVSYANINVYNDNYFTDKNSISDWAVSSVNFAYDNGIMQGVGNNCIDPLANTTCEQAILLVYRTVNKYYDEESQLDSIYELTEEHIAQDDETFVHYTDNMILAFIESGLSEDEKEDIADVIDGDIVAQLAGSINLLQIEVEVSTYDELNAMAEKLMEDEHVYYASPDILKNKDVLQYGAIEKPYTQSNYNGENEWWVDAVDAQEVWNNYEEYVNNYSVGVIDSIIHVNHNELEKRVTFATQYYKNLNHEKMLEVSKYDSGYANHGSAISGIISARRDGIGVTGIANQSNIVFANFKANEEDWNSFSGDLYALKKLVESGVHLINESIQEVYYDEAYFMKYKDSDDIYPEHFMRTETYESYRKAMELFLRVEAKIYSSTLCQLIKNGEDILLVQCAGNGKNNIAIKGEYTGVDVRNAGLWTCVTESYCDDIINKYGLTKNELREHIMIVGAVENSKQDENYLMTGFSNYGNIVDICAPGQDIVVCNATGKYIDENKEEYNTWYNPSSGTSEAAPMVTGTAAILWGIDPTLTAAEVKKCIINGAKYKAIGVTGEDAGREYPMLNVRGAVEQLLHKCSITVLDKDTNEPIEGAVVSYNNMNFTTDKNGDCDIYMLNGSHDLYVSCDGYVLANDNVDIKDNPLFSGSFTKLETIYLEKDKPPLQYSSAKKFNIVEEYDGKVYSGIEGGNAIHVGDAGEKTAFCIYDNYIYYCPIDFSSSIDWTFYYDNFRLWRTDLDGSNKVSVLYVENNDDWSDTLTYTSLPIIIDNKIYFTVNQYDSDSEESVLGTTCVLDMNNPEFYENYGQTYWKRKGSDLHAKDKNAMHIIGANNNLLIYSPNDPYQWQPPFKNGVTVYDLNSGIYSNILTNGNVDACFADDNNIYIITDDGTNKGTYKYIIDSGDMERVSEKKMSFVRNGVGYYVEDGSIYSLNMTTLQVNEFLLRYGENYYDKVFDVTDEYIYLKNSGQTDNFNLCQINLKTKEQRLISTCSYYNW